MSNQTRRANSIDVVDEENAVFMAQKSLSDLNEKVRVKQRSLEDARKMQASELKKYTDAPLS